MKKTAIMLLVLVLFTGMLPVMADNSNFNETGYPIVNEKVTYTFFAPHNTAVEDYYTNTFVQMMEEKTNVHIEWILVPPSGLAEKNPWFLPATTCPMRFSGQAFLT